MTRTLRRTLLLLTFLALSTATLDAQDRWVVNEMGEIAFHSDSLYTHPIRSLRGQCTFTHIETRSRYTHDMFWDGSHTYRIRFTPPLSGEWSWKTVSSDTGNKGLHGVTGTFSAGRNDGSAEFDRHGWLKPSSDGRYLMHSSGKPFFWLGCTAWEMTWKSNLKQVRDYLSDRKRKNFTAIQIVVLSHHINFDYGVVNRNGATSQLDGDPSLYNPEYFRYLDTIVQLVNEHDMVAVLVPMWAHLSDLYRNPDSGKFVQLSAEQCRLLARYVGARYGGRNVVWIVGGDNAYDTPARKGLMADVAHTLDEASGGRHLTTIHPHGWGASFDYFDNTTDWLDFHMYQSSHDGGADYTWLAALQGYALSDPIPVLNAEPCYEDIYDALWQPGNPNMPETFRIEAHHVRQASYESILSGSIVGITYGANGIWQWNTPDLRGILVPTFFVDSAVHLPGSGQMTILRRILEEVEWYRLRPFREGVVRTETLEDEFVPCAAGDSVVISYIPLGTRSVTYDLPDHPHGYVGLFISPVDDAVRIPIDMESLDVDGTVTVEPPDTADWVAVFHSKTPQRLPEPGVPALVHGVNPDPHLRESQLRISLSQDAHGELRIIDLLGRTLSIEHVVIDRGGTSIPLPVVPAGSYHYRVLLELDSGVRTLLEGSFISLGM